MKYFLYFLLFILMGCVKDISDATKFDNVRISNLNGIYALPIVDSKVTLEDLIAGRDERNFLRDNNLGYLSVVFDTISYTLDVSQYVVIPPLNASESINLTPIPSFGTIPDGTEVSLLTNQAGQKTVTVGSFELDKIDFKAANIVITTKNNSTHSMSYTVEFPTLKDANGIGAKMITTGIGDKTTTLNLTNYSWDMTGGGTSYNKVDYIVSAKITKNGNVEPSTIGFDMAVSGIEYKTIQGYFGNTDFSPISVNLPFDLFKTNTTGGTLEVTNPIIKIIFDNDFRLPIQVSLTNNLFNIKYTDNTIDNIGGIPLPYTLNAAPSASQALHDSLVFSNITPNLATIISKNPKEISFGLNTKLNPNGNTGTRNIIRREDKIKVRTIFELPLRARAKNFSLNRNFNVSIADIKNQDSVIDKVEFKLLLENTLPLEDIIQLDFLDPNNNSVSVKSLLPPNYLVLTGSQNSIPTKTETVFTITGAEWIDLVNKGVNEMRLSNKLSTANQGANFEILKRDQFINMNLGVKIYLKAKL